ncbi:helix-turn-helix domain-containing protein [Patescibacteria group bacterium]|nr:helix-turn-helix domain-containing protein [Patescibacteria group bacterium]
MIVSKLELIDLYIKKGYSVSQISRGLGCSENTINYWIKKFDIPKRNISDAMYKRHNPNGDPFKFSYPVTIEKAKLLGIGLGLYWGEGNKVDKNSIRLGNTDPKLIKKFIDFLVNICKITPEKLRFGLQIFSDTDPKHALEYWINAIDFPRKHFLPTVVVSPARGEGSYRKKSMYGVLTVYFHNKKLKSLLMDMLN